MRTLLGLLIFGNAAVLAGSKHATRFKGQPRPFFSPLCSRFEPASRWCFSARFGNQMPCMRIRPRSTLGNWERGPQMSSSEPPAPSRQAATPHSSPRGLGRAFRGLSLCFRLPLLFILGRSQAEPRKIFISPTTETLWLRRRPRRCLLDEHFCLVFVCLFFFPFPLGKGAQWRPPQFPYLLVNPRLLVPAPRCQRLKSWEICNQITRVLSPGQQAQLKFFSNLQACLPPGKAPLRRDAAGVLQNLCFSSGLRVLSPPRCESHENSLRLRKSNPSCYGERRSAN